MPNKELLLRIADLVERETDNGPTYDQNSWGHLKEMAIYLSEDDDPDEKPLCGTTACIAGWAAILSDYTKPQVTTKLDYASLMDHSPRVTRAQIGYVWAKAPTQAEIDAWEERHHAQGHSNLPGQYHRIGNEFQSNISDMALFLLDLGYEFSDLFNSEWAPPAGMTVAEALRAIADGASLESVTDYYHMTNEEESD